MTFIEQWQDELADSLFEFAQLEPEAGDDPRLDEAPTTASSAPTDRLIVTASGDHTLRVWDARSGDPMAILGVNGPLVDCACSGDGQHIIAVGKRGIYFVRLVRWP